MPMWSHPEILGDGVFGLYRRHQDQQQQRDDTSLSFRHAALCRRALRGWRHSRERSAELLDKSVSLWTASSQRTAFRRWRTHVAERKALVARLAQAAAANTRVQPFKVWTVAIMTPKNCTLLHQPQQKMNAPCICWQIFSPLFLRLDPLTCKP